MAIYLFITNYNNLFRGYDIRHASSQSDLVLIASPSCPSCPSYLSCLSSIHGHANDCASFVARFSICHDLSSPYVSASQLDPVLKSLA